MGSVASPAAPASSTPTPDSPEAASPSSAPRSPMRLPRMRRGWTAQRVIIGLLLIALSGWACLRAWADIFVIAAGDEEASQVWLALPVAAWLVWGRWTAVQRTRPTYSFWGPAIIALGVLIHELGFRNYVQVAWHGGAVLMLIGAIFTVVGPKLVWRLWPALLVFAFLVPVPGAIRQELAMPLQTLTAASAEFVFELLGVRVSRVGNTLQYNGETMLVAEACNGMRMMFALVLVAYAFAFGTPLRPSVRVALIVLSPIAAVLCNVIRVVPTVLLTGHYPDTAGPMFHDLAGWAMLAVSFLLLMGFIRMLRWAEVPVMQPQATLASG
ncbi:MAG: exosortase/archaeosortase family protein [Planctomycetota bacterium]